MVYILVFISLFILSFATLKIRVNILDLNNVKMDRITFKIKMKVYSFWILKLFEIDFKDNGYKIFFKEEKYNYSFLEIVKILFTDEDKSFFKLITLEKLKELGYEIKKLDLKLDIGLDNMAATNYVVAIVSGILGIFFNLKVQNPQKSIKYKVFPIYDDLKLKFEINSILQISGYNAYKFLFCNKELIRNLTKLFKCDKKIKRNLFYNKKLNKVSI